MSNGTPKGFDEITDADTLPDEAFLRKVANHYLRKGCRVFRSQSKTGADLFIECPCKVLYVEVTGGKDKKAKEVQKQLQFTADEVTADKAKAKAISGCRRKAFVFAPDGLKEAKWLSEIRVRNGNGGAEDVEIKQVKLQEKLPNGTPGEEDEEEDQ